MSKRQNWLSAAAGASVLLAFGLYWFQPWKLLTSKTVNDSAPVIASATSSSPAANASGNATASPGPAVAPNPATPCAAPSGTGNAATAVLIAGGVFVAHEHQTSGKAELVRLANNGCQLIIRELSTSDGPDLRVWLTDQAVKPGSEGWGAFDDGKYVELGKLKGTNGTLVYDLPDGSVPADFKSVAIWCKRFSVSFGAAPLAIS